MPSFSIHAQPPALRGSANSAGSSPSSADTQHWPDAVAHLNAHLELATGGSTGGASVWRGGVASEADGALGHDMAPSGIPIDLPELKVASGAAGRGINDPDTVDMHQRYEAALRRLGQNLSPTMQPLVNDAADDVSFMNEVFERNRLQTRGGRDELGEEVMSRLQSRGQVLIPAYGKWHAMLAEIKLQPDGSYRVRIYNSGDGMPLNHERHPRGNGKYATFAQYEVPSISATDIDKLLALAVRTPHRFGPGSDPQHIYNWATLLKGSEKSHLNPNDITWQSPQKATDCTVEALNAYLRDRVVAGVGKSSASTPPNAAFAKSFYREIKAAYLNQVLADYTAQHGSPAEAKPFLEVARVRADQAEISAGFGALSTEDSGAFLVESHKSYVRVYGLIKDFVQRDAPSARLTYFGRETDVVKDTVASVGEWVVYRGTSGAGQDFRFNKRTGVLTVGGAGSFSLKETFSPILGEGDHLLGIHYDNKIGSFHSLKKSTFHLSSASLANTAELRHFLDADEIAKLAHLGGDLYITVSDLGQGSYALEGCAYSPNKSALVRFSKDSQQLNMRMSEPVQGNRPAPIGALSAPELLLTEESLAHGRPDLMSHSFTRPDGTRVTQTVQSSTLAAGSEQAAAALAQLQSEVPGLSADELTAFGFEPAGGPLSATTETTQTVQPDGTQTQRILTRFSQTRADGSQRTLIRSQVDGAVEWTSRQLSADGKSLNEITRVQGSDGVSKRTAVVQADGSVRETLDERADAKAIAIHPDQAYAHTERTTRVQPDGSRRVTEDVWRGDTESNGSGAGWSSWHEHKEIVSAPEQGSDGVQRSRETAESQITEGGKLSTTKTEQLTAHLAQGDVVESVRSEITTPAGITVQSETQQGRTTEGVKVGDAFVSPERAPQTAEVKAALAMQDLARSSVVSSLAADHGLEAVAPLLADPANLSEASKRPAQLQELLETRATRSMQRVYTSGGLMAGGGAMALYQGVMGIFALRDGLKAGDNYLIGMGATGLAAGGAQVAELGLQGASLMSSSSRATATLSRIGSVAGKLALGLGAVAMGMSIPGLVDAIKRGDTKAIVSSSVGLGGGLAAMVAGAAIGGPIGAAVGLVIGGLVIGFVELFNKLFNPGTPVKGADPLLALPQAERTQALQAAQTLLSHWDGSSLSEDRLKELSASGPNDGVKAAAQFFIDHPTLRQWMDAANAGGGNLDKRDARFDGEITKSDLVRYIGYMAVPPEIYQTLPAPSQDARLWALGILDPQTHEQVVDEFGKDGEGQGGGDGVAALPEYANIASGAFDERTRELLQERYAGESDEKITQHLTLLKKTCAYLAAYPSELRALESFKNPGQEDGKVGTEDVEMMREANQARIDELLAAHPNGLPSFNDNAQAHSALGANNPALWRPDRFDNPNPDRLQSYYQVMLQVMLEHAGQIDANTDGQLDWAEMANAREQALQQQQYGLYYALDYVMRNSADLFQDRGEGTKLQLSKADLALKAGQDKLSATQLQMLLQPSLQARQAEAATLSSFLSEHPSTDPMTLDALYRLSAGYWQNAQSQEVLVPPAVQQAALYFTQNLGEQAALGSLQTTDDQLTTRVITLADLQALAAQAAANTDALAQDALPAKPQTEEQRALQLSPQGATQQQAQHYWAYLQQHFDEIELMAYATHPADGQASLGDFQKAQQKALQDGHWEGYYAISWMLLNFSTHDNTNALLSKDAVQAGAAKSLLNANLDQIDQAGNTQEARNMARLMQDS